MITPILLASLRIKMTGGVKKKRCYVDVALRCQVRCARLVPTHKQSKLVLVWMQGEYAFMDEISWPERFLARLLGKLGCRDRMDLEH